MTLRVMTHSGQFTKMFSVLWNTIKLARQCRCITQHRLICLHATEQVLLARLFLRMDTTRAVPWRPSAVLTSSLTQVFAYKLTLPCNVARTGLVLGNKAHLMLM